MVSPAEAASFISYFIERNIPIAPRSVAAPSAMRWRLIHSITIEVRTQQPVMNRIVS